MRPAGKVVDENEIIPNAYLMDNFPFAAAEALLGEGTQGTRVIQYVCITRMKESDLKLNVYMYDIYGLSNEHSTWFGIFWI